jgi:hypothetical protein
MMATGTEAERRRTDGELFAGALQLGPLRREVSIDAAEAERR